MAPANVPASGHLHLCHYCPLCLTPPLPFFRLLQLPASSEGLFWPPSPAQHTPFPTIFLHNTYHLLCYWLFASLRLCPEFPGGSGVKNNVGKACNVGDVGSIPGSARSLEKGMLTHSSIFAWRISWTEEPDGLRSIASQRVRHNLATKQQQFFQLTQASWGQGSLRVLILSPYQIPKIISITE